jgi:hypothetical protein
MLYLLASICFDGKVAGLQINIQNNGKPSKPNHLVVRSVSETNALIVIDGSVSSQGAFDDLNPMMSLLLVSLRCDGSCTL